MNLRNAFLAIISLVLLVNFLSTDARAQGAPDLRIVMTGYLLGYHRVPDVQPTDFLGDCLFGTDATTPWAKASPAALDLKNKGEVPFTHDGSAIFVGMGDNFGVELYSRTYGVADGGAHPEDLHPKLRNPGPWPSNASLQIGDNVGCFLSLAGYDVIVPGKEDFYFGPERLRRIAQRLASVPETKDSPFHPVPMLAANLVQQTSYWKDQAKIPDSQKRLHFIPGLPNHVQAKEITDHGTVLPFLNSVTFQLDADTPDPRPYLCPASPNVDPDAITEECSATTPLVLTYCDSSNQNKICPGNEPGKVVMMYTIPDSAHLMGNANSNYGLCVPKGTKDKYPRCIRFTVARPFFLAASCPAEGAARADKCEPYEKPYVLRRLSDS